MTNLLPLHRGTRHTAYGQYEIALHRPHQNRPGQGRLTLKGLKKPGKARKKSKIKGLWKP
jgi:hypothetical protein